MSSALILASTFLPTTADPPIHQGRLHTDTFLPSSFSPIDRDALLHGGFPYGCISSIAGSRGIGKTLLEISYHLTASHLLLNPLSHVAWIDTTGTFCPDLLHRVILKRLKGQFVPYDFSDSAPRDSGKRNIQSMASRLLDRVQLMRVFDLVGVMEAATEVREFCEKQGGEDKGKNKIKFAQKGFVREDSATTTIEGERRLEVTENENTHRQDNWQAGRHRRVSERRKRCAEIIAYDSLGESDEEEDEGSSDDQRHHHIPSSSSSKAPFSPPANLSSSNTGIGLVIVNSITSPVLSLLTKPSATGLFKAEALALLSTLSCTLSLLAKQFSICILFINDTESLPRTTSQRYPLSHNANSSFRQPTPQSALSPDSIPALGPYLQYHVELSCLLTRHAMNNGNNTMENAGEEEIVFEVLSDRCGDRGGRWAVVPREVFADVEK